MFGIEKDQVVCALIASLQEATRVIVNQCDERRRAERVKLAEASPRKRVTRLMQTASIQKWLRKSEQRY